MIPYIGDISKNDAIVLQECANNATSILEFGCGASTQVLAACTTGLMLSIDTEQSWMDKTQENLKILRIENPNVHFQDYYRYMKNAEVNPIVGNFDFIFDDGADSLRREFAIKIWPKLAVGGVLAFHDTRRGHDFRNVLEVLATFQDEVGRVYFNYLNSNITLVVKKISQPYDNWQITEKREPWQLGYNTPPQSFIDSLKGEKKSE